MHSRTAWCIIPAMQTILVFVPFSRYIFRQTLAGVRRFYGNEAKVQVIENCTDASRLRELLDFWHPDGCIVEASEGTGIFTRRNLGNTPIVYLDRAKFDGAAFDVAQDYAAGAAEAARELISSTTPHYAFVGYRTATTWSRERGKAFQKAVRLNGLPCANFERILPGNERQKALREWVAALPTPCGIMAANDIVAEEVLAVCSNLKLRVPEDVMVVGCDNDEQICEQTTPAISSVCPDFERGGYLCAKLLDAQMRNQRLRPKRLTYGIIGLLRRSSSVPALKSDSRVTAAVKIIRAMACNGLSAADVASSMGCSKRLAQMRFRSITGKTIRDAISEVRMERAMVLLMGGDMPIGAIAKSCGYNSDTALRIAFRKHFGMPMRDYRAKAKLGH